MLVLFSPVLLHVGVADLLLWQDQAIERPFSAAIPIPICTYTSNFCLSSVDVSSEAKVSCGLTLTLRYELSSLSFTHCTDFIPRLSTNSSTDARSDAVGDAHDPTVEILEVFDD